MKKTFSQFITETKGQTKPIFKIGDVVHFKDKISNDIIIRNGRAYDKWEYPKRLGKIVDLSSNGVYFIIKTIYGKDKNTFSQYYVPKSRIIKLTNQEETDKYLRQEDFINQLNSFNV